MSLWLWPRCEGFLCGDKTVIKLTTSSQCLSILNWCEWVYGWPQWYHNIREIFQWNFVALLIQHLRTGHENWEHSNIRVKLQGCYERKLNILWSCIVKSACKGRGWSESLKSWSEGNCPLLVKVCQSNCQYSPVCHGGEREAIMIEQLEHTEHTADHLTLQ